MDSNAQRALAVEVGLKPLLEARKKKIISNMISNYRNNDVTFERLYSQVATLAELESLEIDILNEARQHGG